jgi:proteasome lid subunit RPN8/RPN11
MRLFPYRRQPRQEALIHRRAAAEGALLPDQRALFQGKRQQAVDAGSDVLRAIASELARGSRRELAPSWKQLDALFDVVQLADECLGLLAKAEPEPIAGTSEPAVPEYPVSSWFLAECASYLLGNPQGHERLHLVTGIKIREGQRTLDRMVQVGLAGQSAISARADQHELQRALIECSEHWGHSLHGLFHSHPGKGALMTRPSSTDLATHERYERAYPLVGAIFERSGYVRFFGHRPFIITLYGKGVEQVDTHLFKIQTLRPVSDETPQSKGQRA